MLTGQMMSRFLTRLYMPIKRKKKTEKKNMILTSELLRKESEISSKRGKRTCAQTVLRRYLSGNN